jgi:hypothetical protein
MTATTTRSDGETMVNSSSRRRWWYRVHRFACVARHVMVIEARVLNLRVLIAASLVFALLDDQRRRTFRPVHLLFLVPLAAVCAFAAWFLARRFACTWRRWDALRRAIRILRRRREADGGWAKRQFERATLLRVGLPGLALIGAVVTVVNASGTRGGVRYVVLFFTVLFLGFLTLLGISTWNETYRPEDLQRLCTRCGYDLCASFDRCPECGLRRHRRYPISA